MRTILHIGQHKTGTTSLQHYLKKEHQNLLKKGLYIPQSIVGIEHPSHYILSVYALKSTRLSPMKEVLLKNQHPDYFKSLEKKLLADIKNHYKQAVKNNCSDILWTNEGLYLLNSVSEYQTLHQLFQRYSDEVICVCCFREKNSFRQSFSQQLKTQALSFSQDKDSYRYIEPTSWLFDYDRKKALLEQVFKTTLFLAYDTEDMIKTFMTSIGYYADTTKVERLNIT